MIERLEKRIANLEEEAEDRKAADSKRNDTGIRERTFPTRGIHGGGSSGMQANTAEMMRQRGRPRAMST